MIELNPLASKARIQSSIDAVRNACGVDLPVLLTLSDGGTDQQRADNLLVAYERADAKGLAWQPVVSPATDRLEREAAESAVRRRSSGAFADICQSAGSGDQGDLRVFAPGFRESGQTHLILDLGAIADNHHAIAIERTIRAVVGSLPEPDKWRSIVVGGCAFPSSLSEIPFDGRDTYPRKEWLAYQRLA